jgi:hypothetical protein
MSSIDSTDSVLTAVLGLLWGQWTELGVAGTKGTHASIIDPEALVVATCTFGRHDPRLFDEMLDWLSRNSEWLDVTRLRRIGRSTTCDDTVLGAVLDVVTRRFRVERLSRTAGSFVAGEDAGAYGATDLFLDRSGQPLPTMGAEDPDFARHGLRRPALDLRAMSSAPDSRSTANVRFTLRALVGVGVRAEVLLYLLTHASSHGRRVADRSQHSQRQVSEYLGALSTAGWVESWVEGRTVQYRLVSGSLARVSSETGYVDWVRVFAALAHMWHALLLREAETDPYGKSVRSREALAALREALPLEGIDLPIPEPERYPGGRIEGHAEQLLQQISTALGTLSR